MDPIVGSGKYTYKVHEDWARPPEGMDVRACAVSVDSKDRVYCFNPLEAVWVTGEEPEPSGKGWASEVRRIT